MILERRGKQHKRGKKFLSRKFTTDRKDLMFFFNTSVACMISRTLRKQNTNEVKDSVIFFTNQYLMYWYIVIFAKSRRFAVRLTDF